MPAITYSDFSGGLDRRLPINVQEANRLWVLRNAYVTQGKRIKKRPGLRRLPFLLGTSFSGWAGLVGVNGTLLVLRRGSTPLTTPIVSGATISGYILDVPPSAAGTPIDRVLQAFNFQGDLFFVVRYANAAISYHWLGTTPTYITDANCPHKPGVTVAASRIFAPGGEVVRYCAAGDAADWTTASDAGFLPASLQQESTGDVTACGAFENALMAFFVDSAQVWDVAVDPTENRIRKRMPGVGTQAPQSLGAFARDLVFASRYGFRSATVQQDTDRIDDTDLGSPVDVLSVVDIAAQAQYSGLIDAFARWIPELGQYWCMFNDGAGSKAWVYSFSKTGKLACWSEYTFPVQLTDMTTLNGKVYFRSATDLYELSDTQYTDDGTAIGAEVQMAFQDAKTPGVAKQFYGMDSATQGGWTVAFKYDPRDQTKETISQTFSGDTRPGDMAPVEVVAPSIAPVFRHSAAEAAEIDALTLYYNVLGTV